MAGARSILMGKYAEIDILVQPESASKRRLGFEKLVGPGSILVGKLVEIDAPLQPESQVVEFRKLSIRYFHIPPFRVFQFTQFTNRVERPFE